MSCSFTTCPKVATEKGAKRKPNEDDDERELICTLLLL